MAKPFQESYIDVERAYSQGQFQGALSQAEALLKNRPDDADDLQYSRLQLLTGHINLYGLKRFDAAATYYHQVVESSQETTYRDLARQGLESCASEKAKPAPAASDLPSSEAPFQTVATEGLGTVAQGTGAPAMPWLTGEPAPEPPTELQDFADPFKVQELPSPREVPQLTLTKPEPEPPLGDDGIVEAHVVVEEPAPSPSVTPPTTPSSFSADELAQLAKGRLRVILH
ncbi:tol-pal system YbgF family protein [Cyanobium sp. Morenito 9A2]|uniref:tetratricopeptide repeat protein n=1 Tax=Cyanobium sp. Morenito 9A2 TaxID=2823718 RepID=UPI0020CEA271|nr:hypothetical protein [Cyanobium sp. Morenito 9A2]MCP9850250.1 hypothetical protein [Cyanobium sp. Morenito 9A2]